MNYDKYELLNNNKKLKEVCIKYGINSDDFNCCDIYRNFIVLNSANKNIFILLDEYYNVIGICRIEPNEVDFTKEDIINRYIMNYRFVNEQENYKLPYPFQNLSLKELIDFSSRIVVHDQGHSSNISLDDRFLKCNIEDCDIYDNLLAYIKFLGMQVEEYFYELYKNKILGLDYPNVYVYMQSLISNIDECINKYIKELKRPFPSDIIDYNNQGNCDIIKVNSPIIHRSLFRVIKLLLNNKGYELIPGDLHKIKSSQIKTIDLSEKISYLVNNWSDLVYPISNREWWIQWEQYYRNKINDENEVINVGKKNSNNIQRVLKKLIGKNN